MDMNIDRLISLTEGLKTKADKMRVLERAGYSRADIARFLGVRYQQVRNTLEGDKRTGYNPEIIPDFAMSQNDEDSPQALPDEFRAIPIDDSGFANVPPDILDEFLEEGEQLLAVQLDDGLFLTTAKGLIRRTRMSLQ